MADPTRNELAESPWAEAELPPAHGRRDGDGTVTCQNEGWDRRIADRHGDTDEGRSHSRPRLAVGVAREPPTLGRWRSGQRQARKKRRKWSRARSTVSTFRR